MLKGEAFLILFQMYKLYENKKNLKKNILLFFFNTSNYSVLCLTNKSEHLKKRLLT